MIRRTAACICSSAGPSLRVSEIQYGSNQTGTSLRTHDWISRAESQFNRAFELKERNVGSRNVPPNMLSHGLDMAGESSGLIADELSRAVIR